MIGSGKSSIYRSVTAPWLPAIVSLLLLLLLYRRWFQCEKSPGKHHIKYLKSFRKWQMDSKEN